MTTSRRLAPLPLLLIGLAVLAALLLVPWVVHAQTPVNQDATGRPVILASAEGAGILFADTEGIADGNGLPIVIVNSLRHLHLDLPVDPGRRRDPDQRGHQLGQLPACRSRCRQPDQGESLVQGREQLLRGRDQPAVRPNRRTDPHVSNTINAGQQHGPVGVGQCRHHPALRRGLQAGGSRPRLRNLQRLDRAGRGPVQSDRLPVERRR